MSDIYGICLQEIKLNEHDDFSVVQLMRTGKFMHPFFEDFEITEEMFKSFKKNFNKKVKKIDLAVDFSHNSHLEAAGWIRKVELRENNTQLWITVEWTEAARQKILDKEYRYMSADFTIDFVDNETSKKFGPTLNGAALTNRPFIKDMEAVLSELDVCDKKRQAIRRILEDQEFNVRLGEALGNRLKELREAKDWSLKDAETAMNGILEGGDITASTIGQIERGDIETPSAPVMSAFAKIYNVSLKSLLDLLSKEPGSGRFMEEENIMNSKQLKEYIATLSDDEKKEMGLIKEVTLSDDEAKTKLEASEKENKELSEKLATEKKDREFSTMLSDGKACEAQRDSFMKDDVAEFAKLVVTLNDKAEGNGGEPDKKDKDEDKGSKTYDEAQDKIVELCDARMKEDKTLNVGDVHKQILSENPELEKLMEAG